MFRRVILVAGLWSVAAMGLSGCDVQKPMKSAAEIKADCDREFGADADGAHKCQIEIMSRDISRGLKAMDAERDAKIDRAAGR